MQINWCLKGISQSSSFGDAQAAGVLTDSGLLSAWMIANSHQNAAQANIDAQNALSFSALDDHINSYGLVGRDTPYISLSAGCVEFSGDATPPIRYTALRTALDFATSGGTTSGYIFRCWVVTSLKPVPELPGFAEESRDLNLFRDFYGYHFEGEVTAKLFVPRKQIQWVLKVGPHVMPVSASWTIPAQSTLYNPDFVHPDRLSNVIMEIWS